MINTVAVLGAGAWGTALAAVAARAGRNVVLQAREPEVVKSIREKRENTFFLPDIQLSEKIQVTQSALISNKERPPSFVARVLNKIQGRFWVKF